MVKRMNERELLQEAHDEMDEVNFIYGTINKLCIFCRAPEYSGNGGIVHKPDCIIIKLRKVLKSE